MGVTEFMDDVWNKRYPPDEEEKQIAELATCCEVTVVIECGKCEAIGGGDEEDCADAESGADYFYRKGWRVTKNYVYCPKCAKKHLKKK